MIFKNNFKSILNFSVILIFLLASCGDKKEPTPIITKPVVATDANFQKLLTPSEKLVVDFYSETCPPCVRFAPIFEQSAQYYENKIVLAKAEIAQNLETAIKFNILSLPTVVAFKNGNEVARHVGPMSLNQFKKFVDDINW